MNIEWRILPSTCRDRWLLPVVSPTSSNVGVASYPGPLPAGGGEGANARSSYSTGTKIEWRILPSTCCER
jgi:hypothetical protein